MKKVISILLSVMLVFAMVGCGGGETKEKNEEKQPKDPKVLLEDATEKMQGIEAMDFSMLMDMKMEAAGESIDMSMEMDVQIQDQGKETMKMAMPMSIKMPSQGVTMDTNVYYTDGYYYMDMLGMKMKTPMDINEMMEGLEDSTGVANISVEGMTELKLEEKEGSSVISFVGDTEKMLEYTESLMGSMQSMAGMDGYEMALDEVNGTITIDKEGYITEQIVDMAMTMTVEGEAVATTMTMTLTYNNIGEDVEVELPDLSEYQEANLTE